MDLLEAAFANIVAAPFYLVAGAIAAAIMAVAVVENRRRAPAARLAGSDLAQEAWALWFFIFLGLICLVVVAFLAAVGRELVSEAFEDPGAFIALVAGIATGVIVGRRRGALVGYTAMWLVAMTLLMLSIWNR